MNKKQIQQARKYSFGSTSAIITNIALIIGMDSATNAKVAIIGSLLVVAIADNISDSLGIHMYQESEGLAEKNVWILTLTNFFSRLLTSLGFVFIIYFFPLNLAVPISLIYGFLILAIVSFFIARSRKSNPLYLIAEHLTIAVLVVLISNFLGEYIVANFK
jgi:vacuolar iron transporter family protein